MKGDSPRVDKDDSLKIQVIPHPFSLKENHDNALKEKIVNAINLMGATGEDAEYNYQKALDALCRRSKEVIAILASEYKNLAKDRYLDRWSLVQLMAELKDPSSLPILDDILTSQIPPEESKDPHSFTTVGEEVMIRTTAVDAIALIAADKNSQALDLLLKHARHDNFSVKRTSIQGYLEHGGPDARQRLLSLLPKNDHHILDIRRRGASQPPHIEGGLYLRCRETGETCERPPSIQGSKKTQVSEEQPSVSKDSTISYNHKHNTNQRGVDNG